MLVDLLAQRMQVQWEKDKHSRSEVATGALDDIKVILCKPQTFMNSSGEAVAPLLNWYKLEPGSLLVTIDDADLDLGMLRLKANGSSGGHHGLESIERHLGTKDFARQKIGIGRTRSGVREIAGHVLGRFSKQEAGHMEKILVYAAEQAECWIRHGATEAMNRYNGLIKNN